MLNKIKINIKLIYVPVAIMLLCSLFLAGALDYISAGYDPKALLEKSFWSNIICSDISVLCLYASILLIRVDSYKTKDLEYLSYETDIKTFYKEHYVAPLFKKFCFEDNMKTKKIVYKNNINKKYSRIKPTKEDLDIFYDGTPEEKAKNSYCRNMAYYDRILKDDYIDRVLPHLNIDYPYITDSLIFTGNNTKEVGVDKITKNKVAKFLLDLTPNLLLSFSFIAFISGISADLNEGITIVTIFKTVAKIFTMAVSMYFAYNYSNRYINEVTLHDIIFRHTKLNEYKIWESKQIDILAKSKDKEVEVNG